MSHSLLLARLANQEDALVERKPEGVNASDIRAAACAFANSVAPRSTGVLFLGVANDGAVLGVTNPDSLQKTVRKHLSTVCYPPIEYQAYVLEVGEKKVVAVEISPSDRRPHFSGPAFVRRGSETVNATEAEYDILLASRNTVAGVLGRAVGETWRVVAIGKRLGDTKPIHQPGHREAADCRIVSVNAHFVRLHNISSDVNLTEELGRAEISYDEERHRKLLIVRGA